MTKQQHYTRFSVSGETHEKIMEAHRAVSQDVTISMLDSVYRNLIDALIASGADGNTVRDLDEVVATLRTAERDSGHTQGYYDS